MFQLTMDRDTKHYRVMVVAHSWDPELVGDEVHVYHSRIEQWTRVDCHSFGEVMYGHLYDLKVS